MQQSAVKVPKVTYAAIPQDQLEILHAYYEEAQKQIPQKLGKHYPIAINGQRVAGQGKTIEVRSPIDTDIVVATFNEATSDQVSQAVDAAAEAFKIWGSMNYQERVNILRQAASNFRDNKFELAAVLSVEAGKTRMEALGEVEEAADLISWYCDQMEENHGFVREMRRIIPNENNKSILRPYGVWAVISPFNFPMALSTGMLAGVLASGNTAVFKPASATALSGLEVYRMFEEAGLPSGVLNFVVGSGSTIGEQLSDNPKISGLAFTGSKDVGLHLMRKFSYPYARPCVAEMGGKNPTIVTSKADLSKAVEGIVRSAFGYTGQKCSACSRVYVFSDMYDQLVDKLLERTAKVIVGDPRQREVFMGPLIDERAVNKYLSAVEEASADGKVLFGGHRIQGIGMERGHFVEPCIVADLPQNHRIIKEELFVPLIALVKVDTLEEAVNLANDTEYGLCAGIFSEDRAEIDYFFNHIEAGVVYANRSGGATTGAWPGSQSFVGWKASGSTGKGALGPYYVQQFMREQSRTVVED
ncbi:Aldehyde Dehydrogenase [Thermobaculum terrenum ATCC BAA-798]|uniref:L-glutamate gamma-semialdehyde dehydrogenase n=1 Tax=Thermobaculum terrenum (strain ATCC BAA-798 / CCMEE 7001 / YNP1) TaxID=525904 RepID=D1CFT1_THET1|nr:aldehyde dehydrogenase family protein [Thermobaculum terrenum]ACZ41787.1 Aldehyde Dehydrogenase [Thermobaculum terrenum ATCC BAA-798]